MKPALAVAAAGVLAIAAPARAETFQRAIERSADTLCLNLRHGRTLTEALYSAWEPLKPFYVPANDAEREGISNALYKKTGEICPAIHAGLHE